MPTFVWNSPQNARFAPIKVGMIAAGLIELALGDRQPRGAVVDGYPAGRVLGPLAPYAAGFVVELVERGYRPRSVSGQLELMAHLSRWLVLRAFGKGRKERVAPLSRQTVAVLKVWMRERAGLPTDPLFPTRTGGPLTRDAIERRLAKHLQTARSQCPTLRSKHVSMHTLRHTAAMMLLSAGVDTSTIALWLGHEQERTTHIYLHADLAIKQRALDRATPPNGRPGRYRPPDRLLAFLEDL